MSYWSIFCLFLRKQVLLLQYNWKSISFLLVVCLALQNLLLYAEHYVVEPLAANYSSNDLITLHNGCFFDVHHKNLQSTFYAPNATAVNEFMEEMCGEDVHKQGFSSLGLMLTRIEICSEYCDGVFFQSSPDTFTTSFQYTIYTNRMKLLTHHKYATDSLKSSFHQSHTYLNFLKLQHSIDMKYILQNTKKVPNVSLKIGLMPVIRGGYLYNEPAQLFGSLFPIFFILIIIITFIVPMVEEKQNGLKEFLVIATQLPHLNGITYFIIRLFVYLIYTSCLLIMVSIYEANGIVPITYVAVLMLLSVLSLMSYSQLISVAFNSVFYAVCGSFLMHYALLALTWIPSNFTSVLTVLFSVSAFKEAWDVMQILSNKYAAFGFNQLFTHVTDEHFTIWQIYCILILQNVIYILLYNYLTNIYPGPGRKPYLYFLQTKFWQSLWSDVNINKLTSEISANENNAAAVTLDNVFKEFTKNGRRVVIADQLYMTIKNREITVLLGHNGAGKTTIINMIMGFEAKDNGKILVCDESNPEMYRHLIGYCPQNNIFMPYMTCKDHLQFFAKLRGFSQKESVLNINHLLKELNLLNKAEDYPKNLSGGMMRRLSLGIAIAGETKVIILDEPSSGLDIEARRELWNVLLELRKKRAILVTTHHMEEAEVLADSICILSNGRIEFSGTPIALKRQFGNGYILKLSTNNDLYKSNECLELIQKDIPSAKIMNVIPSSTFIALPYEYRDIYYKMLTQLEKYQSDLGITAVSISDSTLDNVFLNAIPEVMDDTDGTNGACITNHHHSNYQNVRQQSCHQRNACKCFREFLAVIYKKFIFLKNNFCFALLLMFIPFLMSTIAIITIQLSTVYKFGSGVNLQLDHYNEGVIYIHTPATGSANEKIDRFAHLLENQIQLHHGIQVKHLTLDHSNSNVEDELLKIMQRDFYEFQRSSIGCLQIMENANEIEITIFYSQNLIHSPAILTNLVDSVICMFTDDNAQCKFNTIYAPVTIYDVSAGSLKLSYYAVLLATGMFFLIFYFAKLPFMEFSNGFKTLQVTNKLIHWFGVLFCDLVLVSLICVLFWAYQLLIMPQLLYGLEDLNYIVCALFGYSLTYLPLIYCLTNVVTSLSGLCAVLASLFVISIIPSFITSTSVGDMLKYETSIQFLRLLPDFNLIHQLRIINERFVNNHLDISSALRDQLNDNKILSLNYFYTYVIFVFALLMLTLLVVVENVVYRDRLKGLFKFAKFKTKSYQDPSADSVHDDPAVQNEKLLVESIKGGDASDYSLIVRNLYKYYDGSKAAVRGLSFQVQRGQCFGLLGINGAGKTTTFETLAGVQSISTGSIQIEGVNHSQNGREYRSRFGYCPQTDRLNDFMTAYQILKFMALLRNLDNVHHEVIYWLKKFDILRYQHIQIKHYSGGTKRKLQAALAMIGSPCLVLLDEPTTGVDPISRRVLWQSLQDYLKCDKTIVLSSHSLDECEYLCSRLAIMAQGQFKCLGHVLELRKLCGSSFSITISLLDNVRHSPNGVVNVITQYLQTKFTKCVLRENHAGILTFFIANQNKIPWSTVFHVCEELLKEFLEFILEYSVNEISLEDIFTTCNTTI